MPGLGRLSSPWEEETGREQAAGLRGRRGGAGSMRRPLTATWACALGFVTWGEEATGVELH